MREAGMLVGRRGVAWLTWTLIGVTILQLVTVTLPSPIIGYANNWDFIRVEACLGLWQRFPGHEKTDQYLVGPVNDLVRDGDVRPGECLYSIDELIPGLITHLHRLGDRVDFREIAGLRAALTLAALAALLALARRPGQRLGVATIGFLVFGDIANLAYFNTLYSEFSVLFGLFLALSGLWLVATDLERPSGRRLTATSLGVIWLGLAKEQYAPLAAVVGLAISILLLRRWRALAPAGLILALGIAAPLTLSAINAGDRPMVKAIRLANTTDTYLGAVLPHAAHPDQALAWLGLPDDCARAIGLTWYSPGVQADHPCPRVAEVGRVRLLRLFLLDPPTFLGPLYDAAVRSGAQVSDHLPILAQPAAAWRADLARWTSPSVALSQIPDTLFASLTLLASAAALAALVIQFAGGRRPAAPWILFISGGALGFYAVASSAFGDGLADLPKHAVTLSAGLSLQAAALIALLADRFGWRA